MSTTQPTRRKQSSLGSIFRASAATVVILMSSRRANPPLKMSTPEELHGGQLPADDQPFNEPFTSNSLRIALSRCKKITSPGEDTITSEIRAQLPPPNLLALLDMFNRVSVNGVLPVSWKNSIVVPSLKPQKPAYEGNSYRPIALTSVLCKLIEQLVADRLTWHMEVNHLFNRFQSGFRKLWGCQDHNCK